MTKTITTPCLPQSEIETTERLFDNWFDPIETSLRDRAREFLQAMFEAELEEVLARSRYARRVKPSSDDSEATPGVTGHRHGHRSRSLLGTFGNVEIDMPRARLNTSDGKTTEWKSRALRAYQRRTLAADALIAGCYLAGTNTRRVRRALASLFAGAVGKDTVSRVWRKVKSDWDAWNARSLADEPIVRRILDGTVVRVRLDRKATAISLLVVIGVRADGQKVLLTVKAMGGESSEAWRAVLDDLIRRGLRRPEFLIVCSPTPAEHSNDGGPHRLVLRRAAESQGVRTGRHPRRAQAPLLRHRERNFCTRDSGADEARSCVANHLWQRLSVLPTRPDRKPAAARPYPGAVTRHRERQRDEAHSQSEDLRPRSLRGMRTGSRFRRAR